MTPAVTSVRYRRFWRWPSLSSYLAMLPATSLIVAMTAIADLVHSPEAAMVDRAAGLEGGR